MGYKSKIEWTESTWNLVKGCSRVSEGCRNCYAERVGVRFLPRGKDGFIGWSKPPHWTGKVELDQKKLEEPLHWRTPKRIFVNSMSDTFHESLADCDILSVFQTIGKCPLHKFIILTKRAKRMCEFLHERRWRNLGHSPTMGGNHYVSLIPGDHRDGKNYNTDVDALPNLILGVSCEDQATADERIPWLLKTPAACRMVSLEPLLGPIDLKFQGCEWTGCDCERRIDWVIVGGESGPGARPMHPDWALSIRDQCQAAGVPFFFKQWGNWVQFYDRDKDDPDWRRCPSCSAPNERYLNLAAGHGFSGGERVVAVRRVGKKSAGRLLDGREWNAMPSFRTKEGHP